MSRFFQSVSLALVVTACHEGADRPSAPSAGKPGAPTVPESVYPRGTTFPFMGYSGIPDRDVTHGFSVAGPDYAADQEARLAAAEAAGMSYPFKVGLDMNFHAKPPDRPLALTPAEIRERIMIQVAGVAHRKSICWWYLTPEELRPWRKNEMQYLAAATEAIRAADPLDRPVWMYEPNHRDAASLEITGRHLDIIGKGFYTNLAGYRDHRVWVRWSMEQQTRAIDALAKLDGRRRVPIVMPELCADPEDPADDHLIPRWTRHDVYLGLMTGGKGVAIWSLFPRGEVRRTWRIWYDSYAHVATELTGPLQLGQVFLHGREDDLLQVSILDGPKELPLTKGARNRLETNTTSETEKQAAPVTYPALCVRQLEHEGATYVFLCNSSSTGTIKFRSTPFPADASVHDVFAYRAVDSGRNTLYGWLGPLEVRCFRITP